MEQDYIYLYVYRVAVGRGAKRWLISRFYAIFLFVLCGNYDKSLEQDGCPDAQILR